jgi:hypothetical protein
VKIIRKLRSRHRLLPMRRRRCRVWKERLPVGLHRLLLQRLEIREECDTLILLIRARQRKRRRHDAIVDRGRALILQVTRCWK